MEVIFQIQFEHFFGFDGKKKKKSVKTDFIQAIATKVRTLSSLHQRNAQGKWAKTAPIHAFGDFFLFSSQARLAELFRAAPHRKSGLLHPRRHTHAAQEEGTPVSS